MTQNTREMLSALMDDELSEFELRQLLKSDLDQDNLDHWRSMNTLRQTLSSGSSAFSQIDLSQAIHDQIEQLDTPAQFSEPAAIANEATGSATKKAPWWALGSGAVAAGILGVAFLLPQMQQPSLDGAAPMTLISEVSTDSTQATVAANGEIAVENAEESLDFYLATHGQSGTLPQPSIQSFARLASFEEE